MAHILPHWNWPERKGLMTPVHVYTSGDEAELFLNGVSQGRKQRQPFEYRLRWDDLIYEPGELRVQAYKNGTQWASDRVRSTATAFGLSLTADRNTILADGQDLAFITVCIMDKDNLPVPRSHPYIQFQVTGPGEIAAVDNGDATSLTSFHSNGIAAYNGIALVIIRSNRGPSATIRLKTTSAGLKSGVIEIKSN
jgi:beta-galactosidase